jgi:rod shape-determining protein MreC
MRNLVVFLVRHYLFLLFILLEGLSCWLLVRNNFFHRAGAVNTANRVVGSMLETRNEMTAYLDLKDQNKMLLEELARLRSMQKSSFAPYSSNTFSIRDTVFRQQYEYIAGQVVDNTVSRRNNFVTINRGSAQGIRPDMGVLTTNGVVGLVLNVSENFCTVMSLLHKDVKVSARLKKDGTFGQLIWAGTDYRTAELIDLPTHAKLVKGDTLITSGLGEAFPAGVPVGTVVSWEKKAGDKTYTVQVQLTTDFRKLEHVMIVRNLFRDELQQLKDSSGVNKVE